MQVWNEGHIYPSDDDSSSPVPKPEAIGQAASRKSIVQHAVQAHSVSMKNVKN